jgi:hypothetical protein
MHLKKVPREVFDLGLEEIGLLISSGLKIFYQVLLNYILVLICMKEENFIFIRDEMIDPFSEIFMKIKFEKINKGFVKLELSQVGAKELKTIIRSLDVISCMVFLFG